MLRGPVAGFEDITREIDEGPAGPSIGAFFDLDRTLIAGFSVMPLLFDGLVSGRIGPAGLALTTVAGLRFQLGQLGFSELLAEAAGLLKGESEATMQEVGERLYSDRLASEVYPEARAIVRAHRRRGHTVAVISSATRYQVEPLARDLGIQHVVCSRLEVSDGRFTGGVEPPLCYGEGKLEAARGLAASQGLDLAQSYFYTDSDEDLPLLEHVGNPRPTNPNRRLAAIAARRGWPSRTFTTRGMPGALDVLRTSLAVGSLVPSLLLGMPAGVLEGSWRQVINLAATTLGELGSALAGIRLRVTGEEHLWSHRPAVFIFNHQSGIDMLILCKLLHRDFVGISQAGGAAQPDLRALLRARRAPCSSIARTTIGPSRRSSLRCRRCAKGCRSPSLPRARAAPPVGSAGSRKAPSTSRWRRAGRSSPSSSTTPSTRCRSTRIVVRPATIDVVVHPPIATDDWQVETIDERIAEVRKLYEDTLQAWSS